MHSCGLLLGVYHVYDTTITHVLGSLRATCINIVTPRACTKGKAIGLPGRPSVIVVGTKIARSRVLGICACCKHKQSVDIGEKLVYMRFELLKKAY